MNQAPVLDIIVAVSSIVTPLLILGLSGIGWLVKNRFDRAYELEKSLRATRVDIYNSILEPFVMLLTDDEGLPRTKASKAKTKTDIALEKIKSLEYRKVAFELSLIGSDKVLRAYNDMLQTFYSANAGSNEEVDGQTFLRLFGNFLLEIRRDAGNIATEIHQFEMLEWMITDIRKYQVDGKYPS